MNEEQTEEELREQAIKDVYGDEFVQEEDEASEPDPWEGLPKVVKDEIEGLRAKVSTIEQMDYRLKQAESRVGGLTNELHAAKKAAKEVADAPSQRQISEAATNNAKWDELKDDFPEWAEATEARLNAQREDILKQIPNVDSLMEKVKESSASTLGELKQEIYKIIIATKHPKWEQDVETPEFLDWWEKNGRRDSENPVDTIAILNDYAAFRESQRSPKEIMEERNNRLKVAQTTTTRQRTIPSKSEEDMTEAELRASIAAKVWAT
jgi:hypothetical protein